MHAGYCVLVEDLRRRKSDLTALAGHGVLNDPNGAVADAGDEYIALLILSYTV